MRLLVVGASGRLGSLVVQEALSQGHLVTAAARTPAALALDHPSLTLAAVDVREASTLASAVTGHEAVISTLGYRRHGEHPDLLAIGMRHLVLAMQAAQVHRLVALASAGILQWDAATLRSERPGYPAAFRAGAAMHRQAWDTLRHADLDWTLVCPPELVMGSREQALAARSDYLPEGPKHVSMPALARWMIEALSSPAWCRHRVGVADAPSPGGP